MTQESYTYAQAKARLDEIVASVRKKDISLEASLDLLEEGVRLANQCTELIDQAEWEQVLEADDDSTEASEAQPEAGEGESNSAPDSTEGAE